MRMHWPAAGRSPSRQARRRFALDSISRNGKPSKVQGGEYVIWLWVENAPRTATSVIYEIHDDTFPEPKWTERNPEDEFITWMQSYGDVPITATFRNRERKLSRIRGNLAEALRLIHGKKRNAHLRRALKEIDDN